MLAKGCYFGKIKSAKTFLTVFLRKFIPTKYTRHVAKHNGVVVKCVSLNSQQELLRAWQIKTLST